MNGVRPLQPGDIPAVADLHREVFELPGTASTAPRTADGAELESFLGAIFCDHPWEDPELPSLVYEQDGEIVGCLGIMPRPMELDGRPLRAAVSHNFMVREKARSSLAGLRLARQAFSLPHDVLLADGNDASRSIWERSGGVTSLCHSLRWRRLLSPTRYALPSLSNGGRVARALRPLLGAVDRLIARQAPQHFGLPRSRDHGEPLNSTALLACSELAGKSRSLRPLYDHTSTTWLLRQLEQHGTGTDFRRILVTDPDGGTVGWYLYLSRQDGIAEVVQAMPLEGSLERVLAHLFLDAREQGAIGVAGRVDPLRMPELSSAGCLLDGGRSWLLVHSDNPRVNAAIDTGDAVLTPLECEGWIRLARV